ncbi:MAG: hypothetical protein RLY20_1881 [Verrucomicrobiota bacterium]
MRLYIACAMIGATIACSSSTPTAPTAPAPVVNQPPPVVSSPPVVVTPPSTPTAPAPDPLLSDPRFSLSFYRQFVLNGYESPTALQPLKRQVQAPFIYLYTIDNAGAPIDADTLESTAAALINVAGSLTGRFGLEGLARGTDGTTTRTNQITVFWAAVVDPLACGRAPVGGKSITLYPKTPNCGCGRSAIRPMTVKHELGHALGFYHTGDAHDLMSGLSVAGCDANPSERERFHAMIAYGQPLGSLDPK